MNKRHTLTSLVIALTAMTVNVPALAEKSPRRTAIDDYVARADESFSWRVVDTSEADGVRTVVIDLVSQHWLTSEDVNRTEWRHWLTLAVPAETTSGVGMLYIGGGSNGGDAPAQANARIAAIAKATGTVVAELGMVPNQPLIFHGDGKPRYEDDLIGYAWNQFIETGEARWLPRNAMVKSAVRAMDAVTAFMATKAGGGHAVDRFVVAGGSKRGWTTWLTGAVDDRVIGIIPIVIDVLNVDASMRHHFAAYGFWAPSIGDYVAHGIMRRFDDPRLQDIYRLVDPYQYLHRLTLPKLVLNAAGDQFFLPDSSQFYWRDLRGESYLRYVPNTDHGLGDSDALDTIVAFHTLMVRGEKPPTLSWTYAADGSLQVRTRTKPNAVRLWQATNPHARDFRMETFGPGYTSSVVAVNDTGVYRANVPAPDSGWTAWFLEFAYDVGAATPLKLTTEVVVSPNVLPFQEKASNLPASVTMICRAADAAEAAKLARAVQTLNVGQGFASDGVAVAPDGDGRLRLNWTPSQDIRESAALVYGFLDQEGCTEFAYQLESGPGMTLPPN